MAEYAVLYHDPIRLQSDVHGSVLAAQSVWVCRNDRYAFEVHAYALRAGDDPTITLVAYGEGRYRLALAILAGRHARRVAGDNPPKAEPVVVHVTADEVLHVLASVPPAVAITYGDVIYRFERAEDPVVALSPAV